MKDVKCPKCSGNFVPPSDLGFSDDGSHLVCDGEPNDSGCVSWLLKTTVEEIQRVRSFKYRMLRRLGLKESRVYNIQTLEFGQLAWFITGVKWDFRRIDSHSCAVKGCGRILEWGYWTCRTHRNLELDNFDPIDEFGRLFYSHRGKRRTEKEIGK